MLCRDTGRMGRPKSGSDNARAQIFMRGTSVPPRPVAPRVILMRRPLRMCHERPTSPSLLERLRPRRR
jgi:hypothetical protein